MKNNGEALGIEMAKNLALEAKIVELKNAFVEYIYTEGCSCCEDEDHKEAEDKLGELFGVQKYSDNSGYDWKKDKQ